MADSILWVILDMKILENVSQAELVDLVPREYRGRLPKRGPETRYVVLLFKTNRNDVNLSGSVRRGLRKATLNVGQVLLAVGSVFTAEAIDLLTAAGAQIVSLGEFEWTDESYQRIRRADRKFL
jgi:hypothetical protein